MLIVLPRIILAISYGADHRIIADLTNQYRCPHKYPSTVLFRSDRNTAVKFHGNSIRTQKRKENEQLYTIDRKRYIAKKAVKHNTNTSVHNESAI